jgi:DNA polymerase III delta prime subunit
MEENISEVLKKRGLRFDPSVVRQVVAALKSGKHLLLVGPPGTGKTSLARAVAEACGVKLVEKTASGEWSRVDAVGGPVFVGGEVRWRSGALIEALAEHAAGGGAMLLVDEINRANMDRAFGEFFTVFGGEPGEWALPETLLCEKQVLFRSRFSFARMVPKRQWAARSALQERDFTELMELEKERLGKESLGFHRCRRSCAACSALKAAMSYKPLSSEYLASSKKEYALLFKSSTSLKLPPPTAIAPFFREKCAVLVARLAQRYEL